MYTLRNRLRYKFDNLMSKGTVALIGSLAVLSLLLVIIAGFIITVTGFSQAENEQLGFLEASWASLMRTLDPGTMGGDTGWGFRIIMLGVTLGGIFIVSTLIGVLASGISIRLDELRKGHSFVIESGHSLILGWSDKIFPVISELVIANANRHNPTIVILASKDKVEMEDELKSKVPNLKNTRIICRSGNIIDQNDLEIVNPREAKSIIILAPHDNEPDISVIKTILALTNNPERRSGHYHIVAEISDRKNREVAEMVAGDDVTLIHSDDLISRVIAQSCRQSGLSVVYTELLDFEGAEIYFTEEPAVTGKKFKEVLHMYEDSAVMGIKLNDGSVKVNPPVDTVMEEGNSIIAISEDDDTIILSGNNDYKIDENAIVSFNENSHAEKEKTLILGWNNRGCTIISELNNYVADGSEITIVSDNITSIEHVITKLDVDLTKLKISIKDGNITDRNTLESLELGRFNHIILLSYVDTMSAEEADSKTLIALLHLRNIAEKTQSTFSIVSEMLDIRNKELAEITKADDFIISNKLVSLMISQLSENKDLEAVFSDLFDAEGSEIYIKPAGNYVKTDTKINFHTVVESAARRDQIAIGYRIFDFSHNAEKAYGVVVNPKKSEPIEFKEHDKVIVIAGD